MLLLELGTTIGLFLPLAYVLGGFARGDEHAVCSATPHLFLLSFQILIENIISGLSLFSPPVRALVPMIYTIRRIFVDIDWISDVWLSKNLPANARIQDTTWYWLGKGLTVANLVISQSIYVVSWCQGSFQELLRGISKRKVRFMLRQQRIRDLCLSTNHNCLRRREISFADYSLSCKEYYNVNQCI